MSLPLWWGREDWKWWTGGYDSLQTQCHHHHPYRQSGQLEELHLELSHMETCMNMHDLTPHTYCSARMCYLSSWTIGWPANRPDVWLIDLLGKLDAKPLSILALVTRLAVFNRLMFFMAMLSKRKPTSNHTGSLISLINQISGWIGRAVD